MAPSRIQASPHPSSRATRSGRAPSASRAPAALRTQKATTPAPTLATLELSGPGSPVPENVFEKLLGDIVTGAYPPGSRLPAERDLARRLGASRPRLREALKSLAAWNLIDPRRGSGIVVRERREWSIEVLPAYLRHGGFAGTGLGSLAALVHDLLSLRRTLMVESIQMIARHLPPGGTLEARRRLDQAWASRDEPARFIEADFGVLRALMESAGFLPGVWMLNRVAGVYLDLARTFVGNVAPPADYRSAHEAFLTALEQRKPAIAARVFEGYLQRHDRRLLGMLEELS